jgi:hypothetical protein
MKRDFSDISTDLEVRDTKYYKNIIKCFQKLDEYHTLSRFDGYCLAASDIISKMLIHYGVDCKIIECELMITWKNEKDDEFIMVGFDDILTDKEISSGSVDTHAIIITDTEIPVLIDASITRYLPSDRPYVVERTHRTTTDPSIIAEYEFGDCRLVYFIKKNTKWPALHNTSVLNSLNKDMRTKNKISLLQKLIITAVGIGLINFLFNLTLVVNKFIL